MYTYTYSCTRTLYRATLYEGTTVAHVQYVYNVLYVYNRYTTLYFRTVHYDEENDTSPFFFKRKREPKNVVGTRHNTSRASPVEVAPARDTMTMYVVKRDGRQEPVHFDKITARINKLAYGLNQDHVSASLRSAQIAPAFCESRGRSRLKSRLRPDSPPLPRSLPPRNAVRPGPRRAEGRKRRVQGRHDVRARRARGGDRGVHDVQAPRLRAARRAHRGVQPAQEHAQVVLGDVRRAPRVPPCRRRVLRRRVDAHARSRAGWGVLARVARAPRASGRRPRLFSRSRLSRARVFKIKQDVYVLAPLSLPPQDESDARAREQEEREVVTAARR